tara:strand:- start:262 stop:939 length:678 start_codon:yes stop_codon:yes gene_type:complete
MKFLKNMQININNFNINKITLIQIYIAVLLLGIIFHLIKHINRFLDINTFFKFNTNLFTCKIIEGLEEEKNITFGSSDKNTNEGPEPICKEIKHSVDVNEFDECDRNIRGVIKSKLLNKTKYSGGFLPSGFENNIDWCTSDALRFKVKDIDKPTGKCFKEIINYVENKCWKYHDDNITSEDESIKADAREAKDLADKFKKIIDKKTSNEECEIPHNPNVDLDSLI